MPGVHSGARALTPVPEAWAAHAGIVRPRDVPLGLGELAVLDAYADCHDRGLVTFHDRAVVAGLAAHRVEVPALNVAECSHALPNASAGRDVDCSLRLAEADDERGLARVVRDDRVGLITFTGSAPVGWGVPRRATSSTSFERGAPSGRAS